MREAGRGGGRKEKEGKGGLKPWIQFFTLKNNRLLHF